MSALLLSALLSAATLANQLSAIAAAKGKEPEAQRLQALFDAAWTAGLQRHPERATFLGEKGYDDRWTDYSQESMAAERDEQRQILAAARGIDAGKLDAEGKLNLDLFTRGAERDVEAGKYPFELLAISGVGGPESRIAAVVANMPAATVADYEHILNRLKGGGAIVDQGVASLRKGIEKQVVKPKAILGSVAATIRALLVADADKNPVLLPFQKMPATIPAAEQKRLRDAAAAVLRDVLLPAFSRELDFFEHTYLPACRDSVSFSALPDGAAWYAQRVRENTTTSMSPQEIHELGLREVARIKAEMQSLASETGFKGSLSEFQEFLRKDPRFFFTDAAELVRAYRDLAKRADPQLTKLFGKLPRLPYGVEEIPKHSAPHQTTAYYRPGSPEGHRPGTYFVNTYALDSRPKWEMEALTLHEAVPGHHLQLALAAEQTDLPRFRRGGGITAYVEGWGLYAESLGYEMGFYTDPYSHFGALSYEMWRAIRLVVDTGMHAFGWSREKAIDYFLANSPKPRHDVEVEIDRYIDIPGQALAYKIGQLEIKKLRAEAKQALGDRFDLRAFHDALLGAGALPLDLLSKRMHGWIETQR